jgi:hypothetical protein
MTDCICSTAGAVEFDFAMDTLAELRSKCPVLSKLLLPDAVWERFERWHRNPDEVAAHCSIVLLALHRGCLPGITVPLHSLIMDCGEVKTDLSQQYRNDLIERWMHYADATERHQKSRMFRGRLVELQFANWLRDQGQDIAGLEALGAMSDITTRQQNGGQVAFEVKFIGAEDDDFEAIVKALAGAGGGRAVSPYAPINYLLFRAYEAARQLNNIEDSRRVAVIIDALAWDRFEMQLQGGWVNWKVPGFIGNSSEDWEEFLAKQLVKYPGLPDDLAATLHSVGELLILVQSSRFDFTIKYAHSMRGA